MLRNVFPKIVPVLRKCLKMWWRVRNAGDCIMVARCMLVPNNTHNYRQHGPATACLKSER